MKLIVQGARHPDSRGTEAAFFAVASQSGMPWQSATDVLLGTGWQPRDALHIGSINAPAMLATKRISTRLSGVQPLLLALSHPWSGIIRFDLGGTQLELDLYSPRTRGLLIDPLSRIAVEFDPRLLGSEHDGANHPRIAQSAIDLLPDAVRRGASFVPLHEVPRWPLLASWSGRLYRRIGYLLRYAVGRAAIPQSALSALSSEQKILAAMIDGLTQRPAAAAGTPQSEHSQPPGRHEPAEAFNRMHDQMKLMGIMLEGMAQRMQTLQPGSD